MADPPVPHLNSEAIDFAAASQCHAELAVQSLGRLRYRRSTSSQDGHPRSGQAAARNAWATVRSIEHACRITRVERIEYLIASYIQPWRDSSNEQRLDGGNGLLLTPTVDHLFDKGCISFENTGQLIVSPVADPVSLKRMGIDRDAGVDVGTFSQGQRRYLEFHRENVLRMACGVLWR